MSCQIWPMLDGLCQILNLCLFLCDEATMDRDHPRDVACADAKGSLKDITAVEYKHF